MKYGTACYWRQHDQNLQTIDSAEERPFPSHLSKYTKVADLHKQIGRDEVDIKGKLTQKSFFNIPNKALKKIDFRQVNLADFLPGSKGKQRNCAL